MPASLAVLRGGRGCVGLVIVIAALAVLGYSAFSAFSAWSDLESGKTHLKSGQLSLEHGMATSDPVRLRSAGQDLASAQTAFQQGLQHSSQDIPFRIAAHLPLLNEQVNATRNLAAIGEHLSAAGGAVVPIGLALTDFKRTYGQGNLSPDKLQVALVSAQSLAAHYQASSQKVSAELQAAHQARASVDTDRLLPPLKSAYEQVDSALAQADNDLSRYQDVNQLLRQLLGL